MDNSFKIILAENDEDDLIFLQDVILKNANHIKLTIVNSGKKLIETLKSFDVEKFDIVIVDIGLPHESGIKYIKEIKADEKIQELKYAIILFYSDNQSIEDAYKAGADLCFTKPTSYKEYENIVDRILAL